MKLEDARNAYEDLSAKASDIVRQISLAGVGLIWIFKSASATSVSLDAPLSRAALCIFLALSSDFCNIQLGASIWFTYYRCRREPAPRKQMTSWYRHDLTGRCGC
jgi:hypothetical protein